MSLNAQLAQMVSARLCHDLSGIVGTLVGTLDLVDAADGDLVGAASGDTLALSRDTTRALRQRLKLYAAAWSGPGATADAATLADLLTGAPAAPRVRFDCERLAPCGMLPAVLVPLALNAALLAAEALPRGGIVHLSGHRFGTPEAALMVWPEGRNATWPPPLLALLSGTATPTLLEAGPRFVLAPLLGLLAAEAGWRLSLRPSSDGAAPQLLLAPPG